MMIDNETATAKTPASRNEKSGIPFMEDFFNQKHRARRKAKSALRILYANDGRL